MGEDQLVSFGQTTVVRQGEQVVVPDSDVLAGGDPADDHGTLRDHLALLINNRMREVGIRKILGSSVPSLILLLSKRYFLLAFVSLAFGLPLAYSLIDIWLSSFSYRATVPWWIYAGSASALILLVAVTILYRIRSVSSMNPVRVTRAD